MKYLIALIMLISGTACEGVSAHVETCSDMRERIIEKCGTPWGTHTETQVFYMSEDPAPNGTLFAFELSQESDSCLVNAYTSDCNGPGACVSLPNPNWNCPAN